MSQQRYSPLAELTNAKWKEFLREPEAVFWVFAFPMLLAIALGFAFRAKGPDQIPIGVVVPAAQAAAPAAPQADPQAARAFATLARDPSLLPRRYTAAEGREALRTGRIS